MSSHRPPQAPSRDSPPEKKKNEKRTHELGLVDTYALPSFGPAEGVRELVQNWWDEILKQTGGRTPKVIKKSTKDGWRFEAFDSGVSGNSSTRSLGTIEFSHKAVKPGTVADGTVKTPISKLTLLNRSVVLNKNVLLMGTTDKNNKDSNIDYIGGHGEGMKVGILALVAAHIRAEMRKEWYRQSDDGSGDRDYDVRYFTGSNIWKFDVSAGRSLSQDPQLRVHFTNSTSAEVKPETKVVVGGLSRANADKYFDNFLFLNIPSSDVILRTRQDDKECRGYVLTANTDKRYLTRLYNKGILVIDYTDSTKNGQAPELHFGYNIFRRLSLGRDRDLPLNNLLVELITLIWSDLIMEEMNDSEDIKAPVKEISCRYLGLFHDDPFCLDISGARSHLPREVVKHLFSKYLAQKKAEHNGSHIWIVSNMSGEKGRSERKILDSLGWVPISPPNKLLSLFEEHSLIVSAEEKQKKLFVGLGSRDVSDISTAFASHVIHSLSLLIPNIGETTHITSEWKASNPSLDLDALLHDRTKLFLNDRNLSAGYVHGEGVKCPAYSSVRDTDSEEERESVVCDCSLHELVQQISSQFHLLDPSKQRKAVNRCLLTLKLVPRKISFDYQFDGKGCLREVAVKWISLDHASHFVVELRPGINSLPMPNVKVEPLAEAAEDDRLGPATMATGCTAEPKPLAGTQDHPIKVGEFTPKSIDVDGPNSTTSPSASHAAQSELIAAPVTVVDPLATFSGPKAGHAYTVRISVCQKEENQPLAHSEDVVFKCPLDAVSAVVAKMNGSRLSVSFSPLEGAVSYKINVEGMGSFELTDTTWSTDCGDARPGTVSVVGISSEGTQSYRSPDIDVREETPEHSRRSSPLLENGYGILGLQHASHSSNTAGHAVVPARFDDMEDTTDRGSDSSENEDGPENGFGILGLQHASRSSSHTGRAVVPARFVDTEDTADGGSESSANEDGSEYHDGPSEDEDDDDEQAETVVQSREKSTEYDEYIGCDSEEINGFTIKAGDVLEARSKRARSKSLQFSLVVSAIWRRKEPLNGTGSSDVKFECRKAEEEKKKKSRDRVDQRGARRLRPIERKRIRREHSDDDEDDEDDRRKRGRFDLGCH
ncbi:hypothetical protein D9758_009499 [Tetrapyrgos nigripes]|uniref:Uncharacterized protein n=1 Tax=Tetrapyrgos nigripes TaxID=182062 RepID=A0A8H5G180_9AGAR|nr:hypothetical protein D9758_009499 [Tetrapyrgos nigripes]